MKIALIGWGSLIWEPGNLTTHVRGGWKTGGPELPLEFSRKSTSRSGALTLVIDPVHGEQCSTRFISSSRRRLDKAILDLKSREGVPLVDSIGFVDVASGESRGATEEILKTIRNWADQRDYEAVIWTALGSNFNNYTVETAVQYLRELPMAGKEKAKEYIERAPEEVVTPLRRGVSRVVWENYST